MQGDYTSLGIKLETMRWIKRYFYQSNSRQILAPAIEFLYLPRMLKARNY